MGKLSKKSAVEVAPAVVSVPSLNSAKKGKRNAELVLEKPVSAKKQKKVVVEVQTKHSVDKKSKKVPPPKKKIETSSSEDTSSDSEVEEVKPGNLFKKLPTAGVKNGFAVASKKKDDSSDEDSDSSSDEENKPVAPSKKPPVSVKSVRFESHSDKDKKNGQKAVVGKKALPAKNNGVAQDSSSETSESESDDEEVAANVASIVKRPPSKVTKNASNKKEMPSESSDSDSDDEDDALKVSATTKSGHAGFKAAVTTASNKKDVSSDSSESDSDSGEDMVPPAIPLKKREETEKKPQSKAKVEESSEDSSDESSSESDEEPQRKKLKVPETTGLNASKPTMISAKKESSSSDEDEDDSSEETSDLETLKAQQNKVVKPSEQPTKSSISSDEESSEEDSSDESGDEQQKKTPAKKEIDLKRKDGPSGQTVKNKVAKPSKQPTKSSSSSDETSSEEDSSDESEDEQPVKTPSKKETDLKRKDAPTFQTTKKFDKQAEKTPAGNQSVSFGSKTLFVGNLSYDIGENELMEFFKEAGEVFDVRLAKSDDGQFKGFGHVEFSSAEAAQKALDDLNGQELFGRSVRLDFARERGSYTPNSWTENRSFQKAGKGQSHTIFVKGFDNSLEMAQIESSLQEYFGSCGEITRLSLPRDYETGSSKGIGYLDFKSEEAFSKALELSGSELGGYTLTVEEAKPKGDGGSGGRSGGRDGGGQNGGRRGGRDGGGGWGGSRSGGWGGGRGGGRGRDSGGRRGRGSGGRFGAGTASQGKKTTFGDD